MTNEEAVKLLTYLDGAIEDNHGNDYDTAFALSIEALEKQIAQKPTTGKYGHTECACCGWIVDSFCGDIEQYPFCPNCGQAIDWSDT